MKKNLTIAAFAGCLVLASCAGSDPYRIEVDGGTLVLNPIAENAIRVRVEGTQSSSIDIQDVIYVPKNRGARASVKETAQSVTMSTKAITAVYDKASGSLVFTDKAGNELLREVPGSRKIDEVDVQGFRAYSARQSFYSPEDEYLYGTGQFQDGYLNVRGLTRRLTQVNTQIALPMILSNRGYGILWNNNGKTDYNPADSCVTMVPVETAAGSTTVNATGTSGNRRETRFFNAFSATLSVPESGKYSLLLDSGQKMSRKQYLAVDGTVVIDMSNTWLPPTSSVIVELEAGEHSLEVQGVRGDKPSVYWRMVTDETTFSSPVAQALDYTVFAGNADQVIGTFRKLTGEVPMMPDWMFGYIHCRERYHSQGEIIRTAEEFRKRDIPLDVIVQDWQWWGRTGWNSMEFDPVNYANPKNLTDSLHAMDTKLMLSVWSKIDHPSTLGKRFESKGYYIPETDWVDFFNPEAADFYWQNFRDSLVTPYGIDVWWLDATEPENDDLDGRMIMGGKVPGAYYRNSYPSFVVKTVYEGMKRDCKGRTPVILTRSAFPGMQRYGAVTWSGDVGNDYKTLHYQIIAGLGQMAAGLPWWTYDAGGFFRPGNQYDDPAYQERMLRWIQTSVFLPFMRVHGYMSNTEPWNYSDETYENFVNCIRIREALRPYILKSAKAVSKNGYTMMRPLVFDFPQDDEALRQDAEFMFGPSLLVCPVLEADAVSMSVYLPENKTGWVNLLDGEQYEGGQYVNIAVGPEMIPVFAVADKASEFTKVAKMMKGASEDAPAVPSGLKYASADQIVFDSLSWDFGTVDDNIGTITHNYTFLNTGDRPFKVGDVTVSCSCISVDFPHELIQPGETGEIKLSFMPAGAAGQVFRSIDMYAFDGSPVATMTMVAEVNRVHADLEDIYHITVSDKLLVDRGEIPFGYMYHGQKLSKLVRLANVSEESLSLRAVVSDPGSMLSVECPAEIGPRSEEEIVLTYQIPDDETLFGTASDEVLLFANGEAPASPLKLSCIFMAPRNTAEKVPAIWSTPSVGKLSKKGSSYKGVIEIGNNGEVPLTILAVSTDAQVSIKQGTVVAPGKKISVKASSSSPSFKVDLFTDDPVRPYKELIYKQ